jgi:hypothetical protein
MHSSLRVGLSLLFTASTIALHTVPAQAAVPQGGLNLDGICKLVGRNKFGDNY